MIHRVPEALGALVALIAGVTGIGLLPRVGVVQGVDLAGCGCFGWLGMGKNGWLGMGGLCRLVEESKHLPPERCLIQLLRLKHGIQEQQRGNLVELGFSRGTTRYPELGCWREIEASQSPNPTKSIQGAERESRLTWCWNRCAFFFRGTLSG